jgi:thiamine-monophosphate kinase
MARASGRRRSAGGGSRPGEFQLIDALLGPFGAGRDGAAQGPGVLVGPGDDCARLQPAPGQRLLATTDAVVDGVHFDLTRCTAQDAGWKAVAVNLSDLAAAGARPRWLLCALGVPPAAGDLLATARGLGEGMAALCGRHGCALVGGNVTRSPAWSLTLTALGEARRPLSRAGGRPGDVLVLVGTLGLAAVGLRLLLGGARGRRTAAEQAALRAQTRPEPQVAAGLAAAGLASAAIDVSDGLLQDLGHLCARSRCGAELQCELLPRTALVRAADAASAARGGHRYAVSLAGGEEYALLLAVPPRRLERLLLALERAGAAWSAIGRLTAGRALRLREGGRRLPVPARGGFDHLGGAGPG